MRRKSSSTQSSQTTNTDHATRARDNKRRHRARQKEYVLDLERKVAEAREQGIRATKEVQLAAQRVTRENARLRDLLRGIGYPDDVVDAWVRGEGCVNSTVPRACSSQSKENTSGKRELSKCVPIAQTGCNGWKDEAKASPRKFLESRECSTKKLSHPEESEEPQIRVCTRATELRASSPSTNSPCKLLTLLAQNPSADLTQIPLPAASSKQPCEAGKSKNCTSDEGVECASAYRMLMQYATSEQKMDRIAAALEGGCVPNATGGGCKVRKEVVLGVLEEELA